MKHLRSMWRLTTTLSLALLALIPARASMDSDPVEGVLLSKSCVLLKSGEGDTLTAQLYPGEGVPAQVTWICDDPAVASVAGGIITAIANGQATITAIAPDGTARAACTVIVSDLGKEARSAMPGMGKGRRGGQRQGDGERPQGMGQGMGPGGGMGGMRPGGGMGPGGGGGGFGGGFGQGGMGPGGGQRPDGQSGERPTGAPEGMPGQGGMVPGGMMAMADSQATDPKGYVQTEGETAIEGASYSSQTTDANAVKVSGGKLTLTDCTLTKDGGDASNSDASSFFGTNAALLARMGSEVEINGGSIMTEAIGANGIVAFGGKVVARDVAIMCTSRLSRGIHATGGGTIEAYDLNIMTQDANSSVIALDRGGGTVNVVSGNYSAAGADCAVLYSTGDLTVNNITGSSMQGEIGVIEGNNFIAINNCDLISNAGAMSRGLMILQSGSGDAGEGLNGIITVAGGSLTLTEPGTPLIEIVTNVTGKVTLDAVKLNIPSGILMKVDYNQRWQTNGATGVLVLSGGTTYQGDIVADEYSSAQLTVNEGTTYEGAIDADKSAKSTILTLNGGVWNLTADSHVDKIYIRNGGVINENGFKLSCKKIHRD